MRRRREVAPAPTRDVTIARQKEIIEEARARIALLERLPEWALLRRGRRSFLCARCERVILKGTLHIEDPRNAPAFSTNYCRLCLECAPLGLRGDQRRRIVTMKGGPDSP